jgi:hypothetical protein
MDKEIIGDCVEKSLVKMGSLSNWGRNIFGNSSETFFL